MQPSCSEITDLRCLQKPKTIVARLHRDFASLMIVVSMKVFMLQLCAAAKPYRFDAQS